MAASVARLASASDVRVLDRGRIAICSGSSTEVVEWNDIVLARAAKNCTLIVTIRGALRVRRPFRFVIDTLAEVGFVQIHRSIAVNEAKVRRLIRSGRRRLVVVVEGELCLDAGRQFQRVVRQRFGAGRLHVARPLDTCVSQFVSPRTSEDVHRTRRAPVF